MCISLLDDLLQVELSILHLIQVLYGHLQVALCLPPRFLHLRPDPLLLLPAVLQLHTPRITHQTSKWVYSAADLHIFMLIFCEGEESRTSFTWELSLLLVLVRWLTLSSSVWRSSRVFWLNYKNVCFGQKHKKDVGNVSFCACMLVQYVCICLPVAVPPELSFPSAACQYGRPSGSGHLTEFAPWGPDPKCTIEHNSAVNSLSIHPDFSRYRQYLVT